MIQPRKAADGHKRRRGPRKATPDYLERAALFYLERYAAPAAHLRRILMNKVGRSARQHGTDPEAGAEAVEGLIAKLRRNGLLDDAAYARARVASLRRRGESARAIRGRLAAKGVEAALVERALDELAAERAEPELAAALAYARRRRLGPFRPAAERAARRDKDLAALGRRGFDLATARRVIDAGGPEALEALEAEAGAG